MSLLQEFRNSTLAFPKKDLKGGITKDFTMEVWKMVRNLTWHLTKFVLKKKHVAHSRGEWRGITIAMERVFFSIFRIYMRLVDLYFANYDLLEGGLKGPPPLRRSFVIFSAWGDMLMNLIAYSAAISSCEKALLPPWLFEMWWYRKGQTHKPIWMWTGFGWHWHVWHVRFREFISDLRCESSMVKWWFQTLFFVCCIFVAPIWQRFFQMGETTKFSTKAFPELCFQVPCS